MKALPSLAVGVVMLAAQMACGNSQNPSAPRPIVSALPDPVGDTYATAASGSAVIPDLVRVEGAFDATTLIVRIFFTSVMVSAAGGGSNVVTGIVDIDTDQDKATGATPLTDMFRQVGSGATGMGDEYYVLLWPDAQGRYEIRRADDGSVTGTVAPLFAGKTLELRLPLVALGTDDGHVNLAVVVGTLVEPTDVAPNDGHLGLGQPASAAGRASAPKPPGAGARARARWGP